MKRHRLLLLCLCALCTLGTSCENDETPKVHYASSNGSIVDGYFTSDNMHFYGTATVTDTNGNSFSDEEAWFEFAGDRETLTIYMHATRFAAAMPALDMRIHRMPYTPGQGAALSFSAPSTVPQVRLPNAEGGGYSYQDMPSYTLTKVEGSVADVVCRMGFTCAIPNMGTFRMEYEGRLITKD